MAIERFEVSLASAPNSTIILQRMLSMYIDLYRIRHCLPEKLDEAWVEKTSEYAIKARELAEGNCETLYLVAK